jgi:hypothetical protein
MLCKNCWATTALALEIIRATLSTNLSNNLVFELSIISNLKTIKIKGGRNSKQYLEIYI